MWFNVTFLYIGLAAVSITINLFIANISIQFRRHKDKFKIVKHIESELDSEADNETTPLTQDTSSYGCEAPSLNRGEEYAKEGDDVELNASSMNSSAPVEDRGANNMPSRGFLGKPKRKTSRVRFQTDD